TRSEDDFGKKFDVAAAYAQGGDIRQHVHPQTWNFLQKRFRESNYLGKGFWMGEHYLPGLQNLRPWAIAYYIWGSVATAISLVGTESIITSPIKRVASTKPVA